MNKQYVQEIVQPGVEEGASMRYDRRDKVCEICGKRVKAQGYGGHLFLVHDVKTGVVARLEEVQKRLDDLERSGDDRPAFNGDGRSHSSPIVRTTGGDPLPFSSMIEDLGAQVKKALEDMEDVIERLESTEAFISRIFGREGFWADNVTLMMDPKDWKETKDKRAAREEEESEEE